MPHVAYRQDAGVITRPAQRMPDGRVICEGTFARDGILEYRRTDGSVRRELRLPEVNKDPATLTSYGFVPVTIEHPPVLLDSSNASEFQRGMTDNAIVYDNGFIRGVVVLNDRKAVEYADSGDKVELSAGYTCDVDETPGIWRGQHYDAIQKNVRVNHVALTEKGRAGDEVRLHLDSITDDIAVQIGAVDVPAVPVAQNSESRQDRRMSTTSVRIDSVEYSGIPDTFASVVSNKLKELGQVQENLDAVAAELSERDQQINELAEQIEELEADRDRQEGRADGLEIRLQELLDERNDSAKEDMDDEEEYEDEEEEMPMKKGKKGKKDGWMKKKMDSDELNELIASEVEARIDALMSAERLLRNHDISLSDAKLDSSMTVQEIQRTALQAIKPSLDLSERSDSYVEARYDAAIDDLEDEEDSDEDERTDSQRNDSRYHTDSLDKAVGAARRNSGSSPTKTASTEYSSYIQDNWKAPLSLARK